MRRHSFSTGIDIFIRTWARSPLTSSQYEQGVYTTPWYEWLVTASHCTLIGSSHGIPPVAFVVMAGSHHENANDDWQSAHNVCFDVDRVVMTESHHGNNSDNLKSSLEQYSDDWKSAQVLLQRGELRWLEVIMGTIVMTGIHHGNISDDWQHKCYFNVEIVMTGSQQRKFVQRHFQELPHCACILVFGEGSK